MKKKYRQRPGKPDARDDEVYKPPISDVFMDGVRKGTFVAGYFSGQGFRVVPKSSVEFVPGATPYNGYFLNITEQDARAILDAGKYPTYHQFVWLEEIRADG